MKMKLLQSGGLAAATLRSQMFGAHGSMELKSQHRIFPSFQFNFYKRFEMKRSTEIERKKGGCLGLGVASPGSQTFGES